MAKCNVGVYVGNKVVKCLAITENKNKKTVPCKDTFYFSGYNTGGKEYFKWVHDNINGFMHKHRLKHCSVHMSYDLDCFTMEVGNLSEKEIDKSLIYQIQEKLNLYDMKTIKYNWMNTETRGQSKLIALSVIRNYIYDEFTKDTEINSIESTIVSVSKLLKNSEEPVILLDMQKSNISVILYINGMPVHIETMKVDVRDTNITSNYIAEYRFDPANISEYEPKSIVENTEQDDIFTADFNIPDIEFNRRAMELEPVTSEILSFIRRSIFNIQLYFESKSIAYRVENMYYTKDESLYAELASHIVRDIDIELKPLALYNTEKTLDCNEVLGEEYKDYELAYALAFVGDKESTLEKLRFNRNNRTIEKIIGKINIALASAFIITLASLIYFGNVYNNLENDINTKVNELSNELNAKNNELNNYQITYTDDLDMEKLLQDLAYFRNYNNNILDELPTYVINSIKLTDVIIDKNLEIKGKSDNYADIGIFALVIKDIYMNDIENITTKKLGTSYEFEMTVKLDRERYNAQFSVKNSK